MINQLEWRKQLLRLISAKKRVAKTRRVSIKTAALQKERHFLEWAVQQFLAALETSIQMNLIEATPILYDPPFTFATLRSALVEMNTAIGGLGLGIDHPTDELVEWIAPIRQTGRLICQALLLYEETLRYAEKMVVESKIASFPQLQQQLTSVEKEMQQAERLIISYLKINEKMMQRNDEFRKEGCRQSQRLMAELIAGIDGCLERTRIQKAALLDQFEELSAQKSCFCEWLTELGSWQRLIVACLQAIKEKQTIPFDEASIIQAEWAKAEFFSTYQLSEKSLQNQLWGQKQKLEEQGWDESAIAGYFREVMAKPTSKTVAESWRQTQEVGSPLYTKMFQESQKKPWEKIEQVFSHLGAVIENQTLQLTGEMRFDPQMPPHSPFLKKWAETIQQAYENKRITDRRVHQFRMYIDRHNLTYVRRQFRLGQMTDEAALKVYTHAPEPQGLGGKKMLAERARLHNKQLKTKNYHCGKENRKRLTPDFHSEFIVDHKGSFVSQWNVLEIDASNRVIMDAAYYDQKYATVKEKLYFEQQLVNGESFNYANRNDEQHRNLDILPPSQLDPPLRKQICRRWRSPENKKQYHWRTIDRKKDGYSKRCF